MTRLFPFIASCSFSLFAWMSPSAAAQTVVVEHLTIGETEAEHLRPQLWQPYHDGVIDFFSLGITVAYDVTITNPGAVTELITHAAMVGPLVPGIAGGWTGFGACWGIDPLGISMGPVYAAAISGPVPINPGQSIRFFGARLYPVNSGTYGTAYCIQDGIHQSPHLVWPQAGQESQVWGISTLSGAVLPYTDNGSEILDHFYALSGTYVLPPIGDAVCTPWNPNSTQTIGSLAAYGVVDPDGDHLLALECTDVPPGQPGFFLLSESLGTPVLLSNGPGTLCLGGPFYRWHASAGFITPQGDYQVTVDPSGLPIPGAAFGLGSTWYFQFWHRDTGAFGPSNTTNAVEIEFL